MSKLERYWTGLGDALSQGEVLEIQRYAGAGWYAVFDEPPQSHQTYPVAGVFIEARSAAAAQRALELIWSVHHVLRIEPMELNAFPYIAAHDGTALVDEYGLVSDNPLAAHQWFMYTTSFRSAARFAVKASRRRDWAYSFALLALSQSLAATHVMDLDPSHWWPGRATSDFSSDHVRFAYAIVTAYAVLEQLGLEVRASAQRPSRNGSVWNPSVRADLESRLRARGVNLSENAVWTVRGPPRRTDRAKPTVPVSRASWSGGAIRDHEVQLVDAIADLSWLRSKVASHRMDQLTSSLTIYDVSNAQYLARRLLFESMGWRRGLES